MKRHRLPEGYIILLLTTPLELKWKFYLFVKSFVKVRVKSIFTANMCLLKRQNFSTVTPSLIGLIIKIKLETKRKY